MWTVHYRVYTQGAWRITSKNVEADSSAQARQRADVWERLIIKVNKI
jgi:hypothetical protein